MAIVIQEDKKSGGGWFGFGILLIVCIVIGISAYYLFFVQPSLIENVVPASTQLKTITDLQALHFDAGSVVGEFTDAQNPKKFFPVPVTPSAAGNQTPFGIQ